MIYFFDGWTHSHLSSSNRELDEEWNEVMTCVNPKVSAIVQEERAQHKAVVQMLTSHLEYNNVLLLEKAQVERRFDEKSHDKVRAVLNRLTQNICNLEMVQEHNLTISVFTRC